MFWDVYNAARTACAPWFARTLDDSANRRLCIPEAFLAVDGILNLYINIVSGMKVYPAVIKKHLDAELPFMASENILMYCVKNKGGDRQALHEAIRRHSVAAAEQVKLYGRDNDLLERVMQDESFGLTREELAELTDPATFTGMAEYQCEKFLRESVDPVLEKYSEYIGFKAEVKV